MKSDIYAVFLRPLLPLLLLLLDNGFSALCQGGHRIVLRFTLPISVIFLHNKPDYCYKTVLKPQSLFQTLTEQSKLTGK